MMRRACRGFTGSAGLRPGACNGHSAMIFSAESETGAPTSSGRVSTRRGGRGVLGCWVSTRQSRNQKGLTTDYADYTDRFHQQPAAVFTEACVARDNGRYSRPPGEHHSRQRWVPARDGHHDPAGKMAAGHWHSGVMDRHASLRRCGTSCTGAISTANGRA